MKLHPKIKNAIDRKAIGIEAAVRLQRFTTHDSKLNLRHNDFSTWSKKLWQPLFEVYRHFDCPLDQMHDMLCDHDNIKRLLKDHTKKNEFYWFFDPGYRFTIFDIRERYGEDFYVHVKEGEDSEFEIKYHLPICEG